MASSSTYAFFQSAVEVPHFSIFCAVRALLGRHVGFLFRADPVSSKFLIQFFIACFKGTSPWRPKFKKIFGTLSAHLPNYHCFCKTFLWRKHAVGRSTVPWLLDGKVVYSSCSAVLPTVRGCHYAFQKFPFFCVTLYMCAVKIHFWNISYIVDKLCRD